MRSAAPRTLPTRTIISFLVFAFTFGLQADAQAVADASSDTTMTTIQGPTGAGLVVGDGTAWFVTRDRISRVDKTTNQLVALPIEPMWIFSLAAGDGSLWVMGKAGNNFGIHRVDPQSGKIVDSTPLEKSQMGMLSYHYGALWIWSMPLHYRPLLRVDPATKQIMSIDLGKGSGGDPAFSDGKVWIVGTENGMAKCVDAQSGKLLDQFSIGRKHDNGILKGGFKAGIYTFAAGDGVLWVGNSVGTYGDTYVLSGFDMKTHDRIAELEADGAGGRPVLWNGYLWLSSHGGDPHAGHRITKVDPKIKKIVGEMFLPAASGGSGSGSWSPILISDGDSLWALSPGLFPGRAASIARRIQVKPVTGVQ